MGVVPAIVLFLVIWFMSLFVILPLRLQTQGEAKDVAPGTPQSAPANPHLKKRFIWTTVLAVVVFIPIASTIHFGWLTADDIDIWGRM